MLPQCPLESRGRLGFREAGARMYPRGRALVSRYRSQSKQRGSHFNGFYVAWTNVSCSVPRSVKLEAPCQRSRVHWLQSRMLGSNSNFSKAKDQAGRAGFSQSSLGLGRPWHYERF